MRRGACIAAAAFAVFLGLAGPALAAPRGCDPLDPSNCLLPWPNDHFRKDGRIALTNAMMPRSKDGVPIQARDYNRSDGFSPGQIIVTLVPGLDLRRSGAAPITNIGRSLARRQPIVVIDAKSLERQPIWSELNVRAQSPKGRTLNVHPGVGWREGRRYIVALRNLRNRRGRELKPGRAFRRFRGGRGRGPRAAHMEDIFDRLRRAGIARRDLYLAWDFTVSSRRNLTQRLLSIRDRAFAGLGDRDLGDLRVEGSAPAFSVDEVRDVAGARRVAGRVAVPCFLDQTGCPPGSRFRLDGRGLPVRTAGNVQQARFVCIVPASASPSNRARPLLFGHGLFQDASAVDTIAPLAAIANAVICGTDFSGMSAEDVPNVASLATDLSRLPTLADRLQQGILNFLFLGRLMVHPQGLSSNSEFAGKIDTRRLYYAGGSLGGIIGGALTAVAPDFERAALIVPGFRFSLLLWRSTQFIRFAELMSPAYPDPVEQALINSMLQLVWDRGEANAYAWHLTRAPLPDTPRHTVLLHEAFGDHQVANIATETEARLIGARLRRPALDPGRSGDRQPFYGIEPVPRYPWSGNALVVFDIGPLRPTGCVGATCQGTPPPPAKNVPPELGVDPHDKTPFAIPAVGQFTGFLGPDGRFVNTCGATPCHALGWTGP